MTLSKKEKDRNSILKAVALDLLCEDESTWEEVQWDNDSEDVLFYVQIKEDPERSPLLAAIKDHGIGIAAKVAQAFMKHNQAPSFFFVKNEYFSEVYSQIQPLGPVRVVTESNGWVAIQLDQASYGYN